MQIQLQQQRGSHLIVKGLRDTEGRIIHMAWWSTQILWLPFEKAKRSKVYSAKVGKETAKVKAMVHIEQKDEEGD